MFGLEVTYVKLRGQRVDPLFFVGLNCPYIGYTVAYPGKYAHTLRQYLCKTASTLLRQTIARAG